MMKKFLSLIAAFTLSTLAASAADVWKMYTIQDRYNPTTPKKYTAATPVVPGNTVTFAVEILNKGSAYNTTKDDGALPTTLGTPWGFVNSGTGFDAAYPTISVSVGGRRDEASIVGVYTSASAGYATALVCEYVVKPGDLARPLKIWNNEFIVTPTIGGTTIGIKNSDGTISTPQWGDGWVAPVKTASQGAKIETSESYNSEERLNKTLAGSNIYVEGVRFATSAPESNSAPGTWLSVRANSTELFGGEAAIEVTGVSTSNGASTLYIWSGNEDVIDIVGDSNVLKLVEIDPNAEVIYNPSDNLADKKTANVYQLVFAQGSCRFKLHAKDGTYDANNRKSAKIYVSTMPGMVLNNATTIINDFIEATVDVIAPSKPSVWVRLDGAYERAVVIGSASQPKMTLSLSGRSFNETVKVDLKVTYNGIEEDATTPEFIVLGTESVKETRNNILSYEFDPGETEKEIHYFLRGVPAGGSFLITPICNKVATIDCHEAHMVVMPNPAITKVEAKGFQSGRAGKVTVTITDSERNFTLADDYKVEWFLNTADDTPATVKSVTFADGKFTLTGIEYKLPGNYTSRVAVTTPDGVTVSTDVEVIVKELTVAKLVRADGTALKEAVGEDGAEYKIVLEPNPGHEGDLYAYIVATDDAGEKLIKTTDQALPYAMTDRAGLDVTSGATEPFMINFNDNGVVSVTVVLSTSAYYDDTTDETYGLSTAKLNVKNIAAVVGKFRVQPHGKTTWSSASAKSVAGKEYAYEATYTGTLKSEEEYKLQASITDVTNDLGSDVIVEWRVLDADGNQTAIFYTKTKPTSGWVSCPEIPELTWEGKHFVEVRALDKDQIAALVVGNEAVEALNDDANYTDGLFNETFGPGDTPLFEDFGTNVVATRLALTVTNKPGMTVALDRFAYPSEDGTYLGWLEGAEEHEVTITLDQNVTGVKESKFDVTILTIDDKVPAITDLAISGSAVNNKTTVTIAANKKTASFKLVTKDGNNSAKYKINVKEQARQDGSVQFADSEGDCTFAIYNRTPQLTILSGEVISDDNNVSLSTNAIVVSVGQKINLKWGLVDGSETNVNGNWDGTTVTWYNGETGKTIVDKAVPNAEGEGELSVAFKSPTAEGVTYSLRVTWADKDKAGASMTWKITVVAAKTITLYPMGPSTGVNSTGLNYLFQNALGLGAGKVEVYEYAKNEVTEPTVSNHRQEWTLPGNPSAVQIYAEGYKWADGDNKGYTQYEQFGTEGGEKYTYNYADPLLNRARDSFFYGWLEAAQAENSSVYTVTRVGMPAPGKSNVYEVSLPTTRNDDGAFPRIIYEAIFSRESRESDNCGDINQDGIPDAYVTKFKFGVINEENELAGTSVDIDTNLKDFNEDNDFLPSASSQGGIVPGPQSNWANEQHAFTAYQEIRGFGDGLNNFYFEDNMVANASRVGPPAGTARDFTRAEEIAFQLATREAESALSNGAHSSQLTSSATDTAVSAMQEIANAFVDKEDGAIKAYIEELATASEMDYVYSYLNKQYPLHALNSAMNPDRTAYNEFLADTEELDKKKAEGHNAKVKSLTSSLKNSIAETLKTAYENGLKQVNNDISTYALNHKIEVEGVEQLSVKEELWNPDIMGAKWGNKGGDIAAVTNKYVLCVKEGFTANATKVVEDNGETAIYIAVRSALEKMAEETGAAAPTVYDGDIEVNIDLEQFASTLDSKINVDQIAATAETVVGSIFRWTPERPTDPTVSDTDGDGIPDGYEYWYWYRAHVGWMQEWSYNGVTVTNYCRLGLDTREFEWTEMVKDAAGNLVEKKFSNDWTKPDGWRNTPGKPMPGDNRCKKFDYAEPLSYKYISSAEIKKIYDPLVKSGMNFATVDTDNDGLPDQLELEIGTDPFNCDSDGDDMIDGWEHANGQDPLTWNDSNDKDSTLRNRDGDMMAIGKIHYLAFTAGGKKHVWLVPNLGYTIDGKGLDLIASELTHIQNGVVTQRVTLKNLTTPIPAAVFCDGEAEYKYPTTTLLSHGKVLNVAPDALRSRKLILPPDATDFEYGDEMVIMHSQVYNFYGFDPAIAWSQKWDGATVSEHCKAIIRRFDDASDYTSIPYTGYDEYELAWWKRFCCGENVSNFNGLVKATTIAGDIRNADGEVTTYGADTDGDGMPDGWELYVGLNPRDPEDAKRGQDGDGLINSAEFAGTDSCAAYAGVPSIASKLDRSWPNKILPTDPNDGDTDGDGITDSNEKSYFNYAWLDKDKDHQPSAGSFNFISNCVRGGGLNPCSVDTDLDGLPDGWEVQYMGQTVQMYTEGAYYPFDEEIGARSLYTPYMESKEAQIADGYKGDGTFTLPLNVNVIKFVVMGMDGTFAQDSGTLVAPAGDAIAQDQLTDKVRDYDFDHDGLENYQEYMTQTIRGFRYDDTETPLMGHALIWNGDNGDAANLANATDVVLSQDVEELAQALPAFNYSSAEDFLASMTVEDLDLEGNITTKPSELYNAIMADGANRMFAPVAAKQLKTLYARHPLFHNFHSDTETWYVDLDGVPTNGDDLDPTIYTKIEAEDGSSCKFTYVVDAMVPGTKNTVIYTPGTGYDYRALGYFADAKLASDPTVDLGYKHMYKPQSQSHYITELSMIKNVSDRSNADWDYCGFGPKRTASDRYIGTSPLARDTDGDGMDDYYELFHGLNPLYGSSDTISVAYGSAITAKGLSNLWVGLVGEFDAQMNLMPNYLTLPWLNGTTGADPDGDGLSNNEESIVANFTSPRPYHTDPTPRWMTDAAGTFSYTRQYYKDITSLTGKLPWVRVEDQIDEKYSGPDRSGERTGFLFAFEENEGYDTDGDWRGDAQELISGITSGSDPQDFTSPARRQAMYFDGELGSAMMTRFDQTFISYDAIDQFRQFTVEAWVRPDANDVEQVIIERDFWYEGSTMINNVGHYRANFRLGIAADGRVYALFDNANPVESASDLVNSTQRISGDKLECGKWYHIAATFDGKTIRLMINGVAKAWSESTLIPANGITDISSGLGTDEVYPSMGASRREGAFIIGAHLTDAAHDNVPAMRSFGNDLVDCFCGYIDEVRVWDGARSVAEILADHQKSYTRADVEEIRGTVYDAWVEKSTRNDNVTNSMLPPQLMISLSFDTLPAADGEEGISTSPVGFENKVLGNITFNGQPVTDDMIAINWYNKLTGLKSQVYTNPAIVPRARNTAAHLSALNGSFDDSMFWGNNFSGFVPAADRKQSSFAIPQTMNPYADSFITRQRVLQTWRMKRYSNQAGDDSVANLVKMARFDNRSRFDVSTDFYPLGHAYAKTCPDFWDNAGATDSWLDAMADTDADGLPDWWEMYAIEKYGLDPEADITSLTLINRDGVMMLAKDVYLLDYAEIYGNTSTADINKNGIPDWWEDLYGVTDANADEDSDGLSNYQEYLISYGPNASKFNLKLDPKNAFSNPNFAVTDYFAEGPTEDVGIDGKHIFANEYIGEIMTDHDFVEDWWENKYGNGYSSASIYDPYLDRDGDGWDNYSEVRSALWGGLVASSLIDKSLDNHNLVTCYPEPQIGLRVTYFGDKDITGKPLVARATSTQTKRVDAVYNVRGAAASDNAIERSYYLAGSMYDENSIIRGSLHPGSILPGDARFEYVTLSGESSFAWIVWEDIDHKNVHHYGSGTFDDYRDAVRRYGRRRVELLDSVIDWQPLANTISDGEGVAGKILCIADSVNGAPFIGEINFNTGDFEVNCAKLVSAGFAINDVLLRVNYSYKIGYNWPQTIYLSEAETGRILQGKNFIEVFIDIDENGERSEGEPYAIVKNVEVGWHKVPTITVELKDGNTEFGIERTVATSISPIHSAPVYSAAPTFTWSTTNDNSTEFAVRILDSEGKVVFTGERQRITGRDSTTVGGYTYRYTAPAYVGEALKDGETYTWQVIVGNAKFPVDEVTMTNDDFWSIPAEFQMDVANANRYPGIPTGHKSAEITVRYFGPVASEVTADEVIVEAYETADFTGQPMARMPLTVASKLSSRDDVSTADVTLIGLDNKPVYVMAYIDRNGNGKHDKFEPWGYVNQLNMGLKAIYQPKAVGETGSIIFIEDTDVNQNEIPDIKEFDLFSAEDDSDDISSDDSDGDSIPDEAELIMGSDPFTADADVAGDGDVMAYAEMLCDVALFSNGKSYAINPKTKELYTTFTFGGKMIVGRKLEGANVADAVSISRRVVTLIHGAVCDFLGYDDTTARATTSIGEDGKVVVSFGKDTIAFSNYWKYITNEKYLPEFGDYSYPVCSNYVDSNANGIDDGWELYFGFSNALSAHQFPIGANNIRIAEIVYNHKMSEASSASDVMAYAEVTAKIAVVGSEKYVLVYNNDGSIRTFLRTAEVPGAQHLVAYGPETAVQLKDVVVDIESGEVLSENYRGDTYVYEDTVILIHGAVLQYFGFNGSTARVNALSTHDEEEGGEEGGEEGDAVVTPTLPSFGGANTVPFTYYWKYVTREMLGLTLADGSELIYDALDSQPNGITDGWELYTGSDDPFAFANGYDPYSGDADMDGIPNDWEIAHGMNPGSMFDGLFATNDDDVMAYAEVEMTLVTNSESGEIFATFGKPQVGDLFKDGKYYATYRYGASLFSTVNYGIGAEVDPEIYGEARIDQVVETTVALIHNQVKEYFGFDPKTANAAVPEAERVNTKEFTPFDKYITFVYAHACKFLDFDNYDLDPFSVDTDMDGLPDGWELYVGTKANTFDRDEDLDGDGLSNLEEYNKGDKPLDPTSGSTLGELTDDIVAKFGLKTEADRLSDPDMDGLTNYQEYLAYLAGYGDFDITKADSDEDGVLDYFEKVTFNGKDTYVGFAVSDHDMMLDTTEADYDPTYVTTAKYDPKGDVDKDGWSNYAEMTAGTDPTRLITKGIDGYTLTEHPVPHLPLELISEDEIKASDRIFITATQNGKTTAKWEIGKGEEREAGEVTTTARQYSMYVGMNPGVKKTFRLSPGNLDPRRFRIRAIPTLWELTGKKKKDDDSYEYKYAHRDIDSATWAEIAQDVTHNDDPHTGYIRLGVGTTNIGSINYVTGEVTIDFESFFDGSMVWQTDMSRTGREWNPGDGYQISSEYYFDQAYFVLEWDATPEFGGSKSIYRLNDANEGFLREGKADFTVFVDQNGNGEYDEGEPRGTQHDVEIGWDVVRGVKINLAKSTTDLSNAKLELIAPTAAADAVVTTGSPIFRFKSLDGYASYAYTVKKGDEIIEEGTKLINGSAAFEQNFRLTKPLSEAGEYTWSVMIGKTTATASFVLAEVADCTECGSIEVSTKYFGPKSGKTIVRVYDSADFTGTVVGEATADSANSIVKIDRIPAGDHYVVAFIDDNLSGERNAYESWGYVNYLGENSLMTFVPKAVTVEKAKTAAAVLYIEDSDLNNNGIADSLEDPSQFVMYDEVEEPADTDGDGIPDAWENEQGLDSEDASDAASAVEGDVMAYIEVPMYLVTTEKGTYLTDKKLIVGDDVNRIAGTTFYSVYKYGSLSNSPYGRGAAVAAEGTISKIEPVTVALVHKQVYDKYGFNSKTANPSIPASELVNSKPFTALDKYLASAYAKANGFEVSLRAGEADVDLDGIPDGWELYVGLNPNSFEDRLSDGDGDGLAAIDEYNGGNVTDPNNDHTLDPGISDNFVMLYNLTKASADDDGDGLSNYAEYLITEVFRFKELNPKNADSDGDGVSDYFEKVGNFYLGEVFADHDQIDDQWELAHATLPGADKIFANSSIFDPTRDEDNDGWSNYAEFKAGTDPRGEFTIGLDNYTVAEYPIPLVKLDVLDNVKSTKVGALKIVAWNDEKDPNMTGVPDAIWTIGSGSESSGSGTAGSTGAQTLNESSRYIGQIPMGGIKSFYIGPGSVAPTSIEIQFNDPAAIKNFSETSADDEKVNESETLDATFGWFVAIKDNGLGDLILGGTNGRAVGKIDYSTGYMMIDFGDPTFDIRLVGNEYNPSSTDTTVTPINPRNCHALVSWKATKLSNSVSGTYYLADPDKVVDGNSRGRLREGKNTFMVFVDTEAGSSEGDDTFGDKIGFTVGEPMGIVRGVDVGWAGASLKVELTRTSPIFERIDILNSTSDRIAVLYPNAATAGSSSSTTTTESEDGDETTSAIGSSSSRKIKDSLDKIGEEVTVQIYVKSYDTIDGVHTLNPGALETKHHVISETNPYRIIRSIRMNLPVRGFITEADVLNAGEYDVAWNVFKNLKENTGHNITFMNLGLQLVLDSQETLDLGYDIVRYFDQANVRLTPSNLSVTDGVVYGARPTFNWEMPETADTNMPFNTYPAFLIEIAEVNGTTTNKVYDTGIKSLTVFNEGKYSWKADFSVGDQLLYRDEDDVDCGFVLKHNANYVWRIAMLNTKFNIAFNNEDFSKYAPLVTAVNAVQAMNDHNYGSIKVDVAYAGYSKVLAKVAETGSEATELAGQIRVQAFTGADFAGTPVAESIATKNADGTITATLRGLVMGGTYYVRAYIDQDGDHTKSAWESWGVASDDITLSGNLVPEISLFLEDCDVDQDWLPDAWEYENARDSKTGKVPANFLAVETAAVVGDDKVALKKDIYERFAARLAAFSNGLPGASLTTFENATFAANLLGVAKNDLVTGKLPYEIADGSVKIIDFKLSATKVSLTFGAEVLTTVDPTAKHLYDLATDAKVTVKILKKTNLTDATWTTVTTKTGVSIGADGTTVDVNLGTTLNLSSGFFTIELIKE